MSTLLGFDFGTRFIGVAVGNTLTHSARPLTTLSCKSAPPWTEIKQLIKTWQPSALVVGVPYNMDGTDARITQAAKEFSQALANKCNCPVHTMDERLSTKEALARLEQDHPRQSHDKTLLNQYAAQVILESWLLTTQN